jgi:K+-sensing histidine kinase KdpD
MLSRIEDESPYLGDLFRLASTDLAPAEKIEAAIDIGRKNLQLEFGTLSHIGDGQYEVIETNVTTGDFTVGSSTDLDVTWCRHVVSDREVLAFADVETTKYSNDVAREATGYPCYIGASVIVDGDVYGTLSYASTDPRTVEFDDNEKQFVTLLAELVSKEVERAVHRRELNRLNDRLDEFNAALAHDLRNPLTGAKGYVEIALEQTSGEVNTFLQEVDESLDRADRLIEEYLILAEEGTNVSEREQLELAKIAEAGWKTVTPNGAEIEIEAERSIYADESRLQRLFKALFQNVVDHCEPDVTVSVADSPDGFVVADDGPGLPSEVEAALESDSVDNRQALGLGLMLVQRIVSGYGWELSVTASGDGTTFEISGVQSAPPTNQAFSRS